MQDMHFKIIFMNRAKQSNKTVTIFSLPIVNERIFCCFVVYYVFAHIKNEVRYSNKFAAKTYLQRVADNSI